MAERKPIRQLTRAEKRRKIEEQLRISGDLSDRCLSRIIGCSPSTIGKVRRELADKNVQIRQKNTQAYDWTKHPYFLAHKEELLATGLSEKSWIALRAEGVLDKMQEKGSLSPRYCQRLIYKENKQVNKNPAVKITEQDIRIFHADVRTGLPEILDNSVNLVFVDPPYDRQSLEELIPHIASVAVRILVDGGSLLVMVGGSHLDIVLHLLTVANKVLEFQWDITYVCPRGTPLIQGRRVTTAVKHIIWMGKGKYTGPLQYDLIYAPPDNVDKEYHKWGQNIEIMGEIIKRFTTPGDIICDFMVGGGGTAVAAVLNNRRFIGSDIDPQAVQTTRKRVLKLFGATR